MSAFDRIKKGLPFRNQDNRFPQLATSEVQIYIYSNKKQNNFVKCLYYFDDLFSSSEWGVMNQEPRTKNQETGSLFLFSILPIITYNIEN